MRRIADAYMEGTKWTRRRRLSVAVTGMVGEWALEECTHTRESGKKEVVGVVRGPGE